MFLLTVEHNFLNFLTQDVSNILGDKSSHHVILQALDAFANEMIIPFFQLMIRL